MILSEANVCVLMPVYNASRYLRAAIESILEQTYQEFSFMIINDGSTDDSESIIHSFTDKRIIYVKNDKNIGLIKTLNRGLQSTSAKYLVRMDADDISLPDRLSKQVYFMNNNPEVVVCGSQVKYFGQATDVTENPLGHDAILANLLFITKIVHPSTIIRMSVIKENNLFYSQDFYLIEDYEFWLRLSRYGRLANLADILLHYRWEGQNITQQNWQTRNERYKLIYGQILSLLKIEVNDINIEKHLQLSFNTKKISQLRQLKKHAKNVLKQNEKVAIFPNDELKNVLNVAWTRLFFKAVESSPSAVLGYFIASKKIKFSQVKYLIASTFKKKSRIAE